MLLVEPGVVEDVVKTYCEAVCARLVLAAALCLVVRAGWTRLSKLAEARPAHACPTYACLGASH